MWEEKKSDPFNAGAIATGKSNVQMSNRVQGSAKQTVSWRGHMKQKIHAPAMTCFVWVLRPRPSQAPTITPWLFPNDVLWWGKEYKKLIFSYNNITQDQSKKRNRIWPIQVGQDAAFISQDALVMYYQTDGDGVHLLSIVTAFSCSKYKWVWLPKKGRN